jgi:signal transduction histidine kinase/ActR/RegA family two-component response regulator
MSKIGSSFFRSGFGPDASSMFARKNILLVYLMAVGASSLLFYLIPPGYYDRNASLLTSVIMVLLVPLAWQSRFFTFVVHTATLVSFVLVTYVATRSGGINSMAVIWLNVLALPVLLLLGPWATRVWMTIILATIFALYLGGLNGWIDTDVNMARQAVPWAVMNSVLAAGNLMLGVRLYEHLHEQQLKQLDVRNEELKAMHQALLSAQAHKDEFVAAVGHELRTPMNAILGFNGVLRQELSDRADQVEVVDHIRRSTSHLLQVVNDILDFSQLQAGHLQLQPQEFELSLLMHELLDTFKDKAQEKGLRLSGNLDPLLPFIVRADRQRVLQICRNLLDNAFKFTEQGEVVLNLVHQGDSLRFEVADTGRGIAPAQQARIFRRFEHADLQTPSDLAGTGLGLSICEKLVMLHGGQIGVESTLRLGTKMWFEIPLLAVQPVQALTETRLPEATNSTLRILVVDDNAMNLMVARLQLKQCWPQAHVDVASSGAEALKLLEAQAFDVALIDMIMPVMDGMQLTQQIRQQFPATSSHMPILALTANTNPIERQRCLDAGMDDVLHKPMDLEQLVRVVTQHIARFRSLHRA